MSNLPQALPLRAAFLLLALTACRGDGPLQPAGRGTMVVVVQTSGLGVDPDGYTLVLDDTSSHSLPVVGTTTLTDLSVGEHALELTGLSTNCGPAAAPPTSVTIAADTDATINIDVTCTKLLPYNLAYQHEGDIYLLPATGEPPIQLTSDSDSYTPTWSPDGRRLAYEKRASTGLYGEDHDLYVIDADGAGIVQLTSGTDIDDSQPEWSPDGSTILFTRRMLTDGETDLYTIRPDGSGLSNLTPGTGIGYDDYGDWAPDGRQIAFVTTRRGTKVWYGGIITELHVMNADGSSVRPLGDGLEWRGSHLEPDWSPDGSRIVFWTYTGFGIRLFEESWSYLIDTDGTNLIELGGNYEAPQWSPDGSQILMRQVVRDPNATTLRLVMREVLTGEVRPLSPDPPAPRNLGVWTPDGELVLFCSSSGTQSEPLSGLFVIAPDGSGLVQVLSYCPHQLAWQPSVP